MKNIITCLLLAILFTACKSSPDKTIQKRWIASGVEGDKKKRDTYARILSHHSSEFEFKDGKFTGYQDGKELGTAEYVMTADGKTVTVTERGRTRMVFNILSLDNESMHAMMGGPMSSGDTVIFKVSGNSGAK